LSCISFSFFTFYIWFFNCNIEIVHSWISSSFQMIIWLFQVKHFSWFCFTICSSVLCTGIVHWIKPWIFGLLLLLLLLLSRLWCNLTSLFFFWCSLLRLSWDSLSLCWDWGLLQSWVVWSLFDVHGFWFCLRWGHLWIN